MMNNRKKIAEKIARIAECVAVSTVNRSIFFQIYEPDIPEEVMAYALKKAEEKRRSKRRNKYKGKLKITH